jgi:hypothetical protein
METDDVTVKRQMDAAGDKIRVMTAHGAKGLEAPIVILPDTADRNPRDRDEIYLLPGGEPVWKTPADASPVAIRETRARRKGANASGRAGALKISRGGALIAFFILKPQVQLKKRLDLASIANRAGASYRVILERAANAS